METFIIIVCFQRLYPNVCIIENFAVHITSKFFKFMWHYHSLCKRLSKISQTFIVNRKRLADDFRLSSYV